jgi:hypothetical protein
MTERMMLKRHHKGWKRPEFVEAFLAILAQQTPAHAASCRKAQSAALAPDRM